MHKTCLFTIALIMPLTLALGAQSELPDTSDLATVAVPGKAILGEYTAPIGVGKGGLVTENAIDRTGRMMPATQTPTPPCAVNCGSTTQRGDRTSVAKDSIAAASIAEAPSCSAPTRAGTTALRRSLLPPGYLHTSGSQIVDSTGEPVRIAGVGWFTGYENPEAQTRHIIEAGFNAVRIQWYNATLQLSCRRWTGSSRPRAYTA
jgi:hypothetical protein